MIDAASSICRTPAAFISVMRLSFDASFKAFRIADFAFVEPMVIRARAAGSVSFLSAKKSRT